MPATQYASSHSRVGWSVPIRAIEIADRPSRIEVPESQAKKIIVASSRDDAPRSEG
jgi:hypothetical protein